MITLVPSKRVLSVSFITIIQHPHSLWTFYYVSFLIQPEYTAIISLILCCLILAVGLLGNLLVSLFRYFMHEFDNFLNFTFLAVLTNLRICFMAQPNMLIVQRSGINVICNRFLLWFWRAKFYGAAPQIFFFSTCPWLIFWSWSHARQLLWWRSSPEEMTGF